MDTYALNATGIALAIAGASIIYFFAIRPAPAAGLAERETLGLLGFFALIDGLFLQLIASLEAMRLQGLGL